MLGQSHYVYPSRDVRMLGSKRGYWNHDDVDQKEYHGEKILADLNQDNHYSGADCHSFVYVLLEAEETYFAMKMKIGVALH